MKQVYKIGNIIYIKCKIISYHEKCENLIMSVANGNLLQFSETNLGNLTKFLMNATIHVLVDI